MEPREVVGKYRLDRKLGQGGMGSVYEAVDEKISSHVALKILNLQCSQNVQVVMRFLSEAQIANSIRHPGIVKVYDHGFLPTGQAYLAMELLQGLSLRERMRQGCSEADVIRWARQTASALAAAHELGVVHRDLKPDNLMLVADPEVAGGERIKVLDFGIARITRPEHFGEPSGMTATGMLIGTPSYMAPEQCSSAKTTDEKADVYALGVILYEACSGEPPFVARRQRSDGESAAAGGEELIEILFHHLHSPPPPLREKRADISSELCDLIHQMLSKSPRQRPSMRELQGRLDELSRGASDSLQLSRAARGSGAITPAYEAEKQSTSRRERRSERRRQVGWFLAGVAVLVLAGAATQRRAAPLVGQPSQPPATSPNTIPTEVKPATSAQVSGPTVAAERAPDPAGRGVGTDDEGPRPRADTHHHSERASGSARGRGKVAGRLRKLSAGSARTPLSAGQIALQLEEAKAALSHGQAGETLRLTRELEEAGGKLSAGQTQETLSLLGRAACIEHNVNEAIRAHAALLPGFHRRLVESFCQKHHVRCPESNRSALCAELRDSAAPASPALPVTLRDPFPGRP